MATENPEINRLANQEYKYGFVSDIEAEELPPGLSEEVVRWISAKKEEPEWLLKFRLKALRRFQQMLEEEHEPSWAKVDYPKIDYQDIIYYSAPKAQKNVDSLDEIDPEILETYNKLGIPLLEQKADRTWGGEDDYEVYKKRTPTLIPRLSSPA